VHKKQEIEAVVSNINQAVQSLEARGFHPLTVAAALVGASLRIYAKELSKEDFTKTMIILFNTAINHTPTTNTLH
jgi:hypothetical protein